MSQQEDDHSSSATESELNVAGQQEAVSLEGKDKKEAIKKEESKEEQDRMRDGHIWMGSGGTKGKHGVGILLKKWTNEIKRFSACSERMAELELDVGALRLTLITVYMPHGGYSDDAVEIIY